MISQVTKTDVTIFSTGRNEGAAELKRIAAVRGLDIVSDGNNGWLIGDNQGKITLDNDNESFWYTMVIFNDALTVEEEVKEVSPMATVKTQTIKLSPAQQRAMDKIAYGLYHEVKKVTLRALRNKGLIETTRIGALAWTDTAFELMGVEKPKVSEKILKLRALQDEILDIAEAKRLDMRLRVSHDMPSEVKLESLYFAVYEGYEDVLQGVLWTLRERYNLKKGA